MREVTAPCRRCCEHTKDARISDATAILRDLEARLHAEFEIDHVTLQFECVACSPEDRIACVRLAAGAAEPTAPTN